MNEFQPLLDLLSGKFGWLPTVLIWIGALRVPMKLVSGALQNFLTAFVVRVAASPETDDDDKLRTLFGSIGYRFIAFTLDAALSLKLPTSESLVKHISGEAVPVNRANALIILGALSLLLCHSGCGTLDQTGVYAGDEILYESEVVIPTSYELIHTFVTWEKDNRAVLAKWPEIKRSADAMRAGAKQWIASANALHDAYKLDPTPPNGAALQRALAVLRTALNEAARYMAQAANTTANP